MSCLHLLVLFSSSLPAAASVPLSDAPMGAVVGVKGEATAMRVHVGSEGVGALAVGDPVWAGDLVRTGPDGRLQLLLEDRSVVNLAPATELTLGALSSERRERRVTVKLVVGSLWARVSRLFGQDREFEIETPTAVAGVRGTSFFAEVLAESGETRLTVLAGQVALEDAAGGLQLVGAMQQGIAAPGAPLSVQPARPELLAELSNRLASVSSFDPVRLQPMWQALRARMPARGVDREGQRDVLRQILGGGGRNMPAPLLILEPLGTGGPGDTGSPDARVRGQIEIEPDPN